MLKIIEIEIKKQCYAEEKRERGEVITREEWDKGYQMRPQTAKRAEIDKERAEAPLTKYLNQKDQPIKQYIEKEITSEEIEKAINKLTARKAAGDDEIT